MAPYLHIFSPIMAVISNVVFQLLYCRHTKGLKLLKSVFLGFGFGVFILLFIECYYYLGDAHYRGLLDSIFSGIVNFVAYSALGYAYFHFVNLGETGRRVRLVRELYESQKGLSAAEIIARYNAKEIIQRRINRLINNGQISARNNRFYIGNPQMLLTTKIIEALKLVLIGKKSEFD